MKTSSARIATVGLQPHHNRDEIALGAERGTGSRSARIKERSWRVVGLDVICMVDNTHPAATKLLEDAIVRYCLAYHTLHLRQKDGGSSKSQRLAQHARR